MPKETFIKYFEDADDVIMTRRTGLSALSWYFQIGSSYLPIAWISKKLGGRTVPLELDD